MNCGVASQLLPFILALFPNFLFGNLKDVGSLYGSGKVVQEAIFQLVQLL